EPAKLEADHPAADAASPRPLATAHRPLRSARAEFVERTRGQPLMMMIKPTIVIEEEKDEPLVIEEEKDEPLLLPLSQKDPQNPAP
ncbi:MAG: hypothetical protein L0211_06855, partial [Planctomycetaceae bacterium]|nr:hypothetical protein [Planctomycetaceae bacterium]